MKITEKSALKIMRDIHLMESMDNMFTAALQALEAYEFATAFTLARIIANDSMSIEQRCAAMMIKRIAAAYDKKATDEFLEMLYSNL